MKVDPAEIETVLNEHPQVVESAVMAANVDGRPMLTGGPEFSQRWSS